MTPRILLFTGAPPSSSITDSSCTITRFETPFVQLLDLPSASPPPPPPAASPSSPPPPSNHHHLPAWRSLPLTRQPLHTGLTQHHHQQDATTPQHVAAAPFLAHNDTFFTTADASTTTFLTLDGGGQTQPFTHEDLLTQFCEHSLNVHTLSTAPPPPSSTATSSSSHDFDAPANTTSLLADDTTADATADATIIIPPAHLSDLEDVPPPRQITSLHPQTITLNLIVGVLSIAHPRTVTTRWGTPLSLIELLVGDNTAAGFAITFWLSPKDLPTGEVLGLHRRDVILVQNVALHVFRGKVHGQTLRRGLTKVHVLWRADGTGHYSSRGLLRRDGDPQRDKTRIVRDWVLRFVGGDPRQADGRRRPRTRSGLSWDRPPDDSQ